MCAHATTAHATSAHATSALATSALATSALATSELATSELATSELARPRQRHAAFLTILAALALGCIFAALSPRASAQFGGGGFGGAGGGGGVPGPAERPKFRDHIHTLDSLPIAREKGEKLVATVRVSGNRKLTTAAISQQLQTRKGRFYDYETVLGDVRRLQDMGSFDHVTFKETETDEGMAITFFVHERPLITSIQFHGRRGLNDRELSGRTGLSVNDPLSEFAIESARRRLIDFYKEKGFNQIAITSVIGFKDDPGAVVFRINEGPLERIHDIQIVGNQLLSEARLKKIIKSRGPFMYVGRWSFNIADMNKIDADVDILASTYHNLGYLTATVGRQIFYDETGKWLTVKFVINEGKRFKINSVQITGTQFVKEESLFKRLTLKSGDMFDGTTLRKDVGELVYGYGELGFIYAEVNPRTIMRDDDQSVDLVYEITEGDRWKIGKIRVNIEGEPHLMRETVMLNMLDMREGDWINRKFLETARRRVVGSNLLETNPQVADPPDIIVEPAESRYR
ncbi:Outer membrane protein assembly factor BamA precursor [Stieleria varia]|uniref:Outer membrane protein assembly factor BamA n=2 Tax=Stieleria varia TaxID=2528005 RepID=A0A5C6B053_9BACT|nr:Outer membrane protein assembly factor BamA precursor [Stieleria varia]